MDGLLTKIYFRLSSLTSLDTSFVGPDYSYYNAMVRPYGRADANLAAFQNTDRWLVDRRCLAVL